MRHIVAWSVFYLYGMVFYEVVPNRARDPINYSRNTRSAACNRAIWARQNRDLVVVWFNPGPFLVSSRSFVLC